VDGAFIPGLRLAGEFYAEAVRPLLDDEFPGLRYAAALLGPGSEILGFDTERSTDHDWGPRLQVFLGADDAERHAAPITEMLAERLPSVFCGYPVAFRVAGWPDRERHLSRAYLIAAEAHNRLGLTEPLDTSTRLFFGRPYQVLGARRFAAALADAITDPVIRRLPPIGAADQFIDSTDALRDLRYPRAVISAR
jgi:hypothetical protein